MVLFSAVAAFSGPPVNVSVNIGGVSSSVEAMNIDSNVFYIKTNGSKWTSYFSFGAAGEVDFNEYFGAGLGVSYEKRGGILTGDLFIGSIRIASGEWEFDYRYLQIPLFIKGMLPLMIPGSVFCTFGPELGIVLESETTVRSYQNFAGLPKTEKIDTLTEPIDFGLSVTAGYDLPLGWSIGARVYVGYYYGFIDVYKKETPANSDADIYNRAFKYGLSFYYNFNAARR